MLQRFGPKASSPDNGPRQQVMNFLFLRKIFQSQKQHSSMEVVTYCQDYFCFIKKQGGNKNLRIQPNLGFNHYALTPNCSVKILFR